MSNIDAKYCTIKVKDGGSHSITVKLGDGNVTWSEKKTREYKLDRGVLDTVRNGDQTPMDVSLDALWDFLTAPAGSGAIPTVEDAMKRRGAAAAWVSSSSDPCEPYSVDIEITYDPPCATQQREIYTLPDFRYESCDHDLKAGTLKFAGKCNVTEATVVRAAQT